MTALVLLAIAVVLVGPGPRALARLPRLRHAPRAALVLWQAVALAAVLAVLGAPLALAGDFGGDWPGPLRAAVALAAGAAALVVLARLLLAGHRVGWHLRADRRRHRAALDLLARRDGGVLLVESGASAAYCLPGVRSRVVVSRGAAASLSAEQLAAVVDHERAHLRARHDLVLEAFTVLHQAFPRVLSGSRALAEARLLVEVLADRAARRRHGAQAVAGALLALVDATSPATGLAAGGSTPELAVRVDLLACSHRHRALAVVLYAVSAAVLLLPTGLVVLPWLRGVLG